MSLGFSFTESLKWKLHVSRDFLFFLFFIFFLGRPKVCASSYSLRQIRRVVVVGFTKIGVVEESRPRKLEPKRVWTQHFCRPSHEYFRNRKSCIFILEVDLDLDLVEAVSLTSAWPEAEESHNTQEPWGKWEAKSKHALEFLPGEITKKLNREKGGNHSQKLFLARTAAIPPCSWLTEFCLPAIQMMAMENNFCVTWFLY